MELEVVAEQSDGRRIDLALGEAKCPTLFQAEQTGGMGYRIVGLQGREPQIDLTA